MFDKQIDPRKQIEKKVPPSRLSFRFFFYLNGAKTKSVYPGCVFNLRLGAQTNL